jgi:hypothetical protein
MRRRHLCLQTNSSGSAGASADLPLKGPTEGRQRLSVLALPTYAELHSAGHHLRANARSAGSTGVRWALRAFVRLIPAPVSTHFYYSRNVSSPPR